MIGRTNAGGGGTGGELTVNAPAGVKVIATNSETGRTYTRTANADGVAVFKGLPEGTYNVTITDGEQSNTVSMQLETKYDLTIGFAHVYGIMRDITSSTPAWARTDEAVGFTATASVGTVAGASDFDNCMPWSGIVRETLDTGDVMVKIPAFYYRRYREGDVEYIKIADKPTEGFTLHPAFNHANEPKDCVYIAAYQSSSGPYSKSGASLKVNETITSARTNARAKGAGWSVLDYSTFSAVQLLYLVEFATYDSQTAVGRGRVDLSDSDSAQKSGACDSVPNLTGYPSGTNGKVQVVYRGIESLWGNCTELVDGVLFMGNATPWVCNDITKYNDSSTTDYTQIGYNVNTNTSTAYQTELGLDPDMPHVMMCTSASGGSASTYMCDGTTFLASGTRVFRVAGSYSQASAAGLFYTSYTTYPNTSLAHMGHRLIYIPQEEETS